MKSARMMLAALALSGAAIAAPPAFAQDQGIHAGTIEVPMNKSQVVSADRAIARCLEERSFGPIAGKTPRATRLRPPRPHTCSNGPFRPCQRCYRRSRDFA